MIRTSRTRPARGHARSAASAGASRDAASHNSAPIASAATTMRGSRRRAAASIEKPNVSAPLRIRVSAVLQAPSAMPAAMPPAPKKWPSRNASGDRDHEALERREQRRQRVLARKERRRQRLDQHMRGQAERQPHQRLRGGRGIGCGEGAVLEQHPHDRLAQHDQAERRRQRQPDRKFERRAIRHARSHAYRRRAPRASFRESAPCPWRRRRCRAAVRSGGWRNRATIPPTAMTTR